MMDKQEDRLAQLKKQFDSGEIDAKTYQQALADITTDNNTSYIAETESGAIAQGGGAVAVGKGGVYVGGTVDGDVITGSVTKTYIERQVIVQGVEISDIENVPPTDGDPPYKGLAYFTTDDADWFFGREKITSTLISRLHDINFLAVVGASGSGKSSLVRAGVIPVMTRDKILADGITPPSGEWAVTTITPTAHPLAKLAHELFPTDYNRQSIFEEQLRQDSHALHNALVEKDEGEHKELLFVDQFEEIFTLCKSVDDRQSFIRNLLTLAEKSSNTKLIITLRADFYDECLRYEELVQVLRTNQEPLGVMNSQELAAAILEPAAKGDWKFQPGLAEEILDEIGEGSGRLPLLSHALLETWKRRRGRMLTLSGYAEAGKIHGAIAKTADDTYERLNPDEKKIARHIFTRLTEFGTDAEDTRRRIRLTELGNDATVRDVREKLTAARLITTDGNDVSVSHEALIREWPLLREWLDTDRTGLLTHRSLTNAANAWDEKDEDASYLYAGSRLEEAGQWAKQNVRLMNGIEESFLNTSLQVEKDSQRNKRITQASAVVIALILVILIISSILIYGQRNDAIAAEGTANAAEGTANAAKEDAISAENTAVAASSTSEFNAALAATSEAEVTVLKNSIQASQLAAASRAELQQNPELSLLLAITGLGLSNQLDTQISFYSAVLTPYRHTLNGHTDLISQLTFSPDGENIITASYDGTAKLWDRQGNQMISLDGHDDTVRTVVLSPDGTQILTASDDNTAKLWDIEGNEIHSFDGHRERVMSAAFSPDGKLIVTASHDYTAKVRDVLGNELATLDGHRGRVNYATFSPDGNTILTLDERGTVKIWDTNGNERASLEEPDDGYDKIDSVIFSPDGKTVFTIGMRGNVRSWDMNGDEIALFEGNGISITSFMFIPDRDLLFTADLNANATIWDMQGNKLARLVGHNDAIWPAILSPDGNRILTTSQDRKAKLWDMDGNELVSFDGHMDSVSKAIFSPDGKRIITVSDDNTIKTWGLDGYELSSSSILGAEKSVKFSPDGSQVLTINSDEEIRIWDINGSKHISYEGHLQEYLNDYHCCIVSAALFSPDGNTVATASTDGYIKLWDTQGTELVTIPDETGNPPVEPIRGIAFNPDGNSILTAGEYGTIRIWDMGGKELISFYGSEGETTWAATFSPDGDSILTADDYGVARLWDTDGHELDTFDGHTDSILSVAFSPDGEKFVTSSADGTAKIWDLDDDNASITLQASSSYVASVNSAVFSPNGEEILTASDNGTVAIWDTAGNLLTSYSINGTRAQISPILSATFSPDGEKFAITTSNMVQLWDRQGNQLAFFDEHTDMVPSVTFSPDGSYLLTASQDGTAKMRPVYPTLQDKIDVAQDRLSRGFTEAECARFFSGDGENCPQTIEDVFALFEDDLETP